MNFSLFSTRRRFARLFNIYQVQLSINLLHILRKWVESFTPVTLVLTMPTSNTFITPSESDEAEHDIFRTEFAVVWRLRFAKFDQWLEGSNPANAPWITTMFTTWSSWVSTTNYHHVMTPGEFVLFDLSSFKDVHFGRAIKWLLISNGLKESLLGFYDERSSLFSVLFYLTPPQLSCDIT